MKLIISLLLFASTSIAQVNYFDHVQPIIHDHCISCHAKGKIGPMSLETYENVSAFASMIEFVASNDIMPPWRAKQNHRKLSISKYLSVEEKNMITNWIVGGMVEGKESGPKVEEKEAHKYDFIDCDLSNYVNNENQKLTYKILEPFTHEGDYSMHQRVFVVPTQLDKDVYIKKVEFIPSNERIVLGCDISIDTTRKGRMYDEMDPRSGYANVIGVAFSPSVLSWYSWSPDDIQESFDGYKILPANSDLLFSIQYGPSSKTQVDQSQVVLTYSDTPPESSEIISEVLIDSSSLLRPFLISPNSVKNVRAEYEFMENVKLMAIRPYGQMICEKWQILLVDTEGSSSILLEIDDWQFKWQRKFEFTVPIEVRKGSKIIAIATYNNTIENTDILIFPTKKVPYGEGLNQELYLVSFDFAKMN